MNAKLFKRAAAGAVALTMLGAILPADSDPAGLSDWAALTASAADASAVFGEPTAEGGYVLENNKTYILSDNIVTSSYIHVPDGVTAEIDMNGCTIDRGLTEFSADGHVIQVDEGGVLTITDSSEDKTGTIKGGYTYDGAGIYNEGTCTVLYITITGNTAVTDPTGNYYGCGGGVCNNGGELDLNNCTITGNNAAAGGGVYVYPSDEKTYLNDVTITSNTASGNGGGINNHGNLSVRDCTIQNNSSGNNGGGMYFDAPDKDIVLFSENTITENTALKGKAIYIYKSGYTKIADVLIADGCDIMENWCPFTVWGEISPESDIAVYIPNSFDGAVAYGYANVNSDLDPAEVFRSVGNYSASFTIDEDGNAHAKHSGFVYIDRSWDSVQKKVVEELKTIPADSYRFPETKNNPEGDDFIDLGSPNGEWYVVDHDITVDYAVRCFGSPHILLCDGATLTCNKGIICENDHSVHIYGQSDDSGRLISTSYSGAGIGSVDNPAGNINIYGGTINSSAAANNYAAGIGGDHRESCGNVSIYGGNITASGAGCAPGIGSGYKCSDEVSYCISIYGGSVYAEGGSRSEKKSSVTYCGAGIGNGAKSDCYYSINIHGGNVTAISYEGSGIGGGGSHVINEVGEASSVGTNGEVTIDGGSVSARSDKRAISAKILTLGDSLSVYAPGDVYGTTIDTLFTAGERTSACEYRKAAAIQECSHGGFTYTVSGDGTQHIAHCKYCNYTKTDNHITDNTGKCKACGYDSGVPTYTVTLAMKNEDGSTIEKNGGEVVSGQIYALPGCDSIPANHRFTGWTMGDDTELRQPGEEITVTGNMTLTANYIEQCKVTFSFGEEEGFSYDHLVDKGTAIEDFGAPEAEGYIFKGWYLGDELYDFDTPVTSDITLTALWEETKSYISGASLTLNGGIGVNVYIQPFSVDPDTAYVTVKGPDDSDPVRSDLKDLEIVVGKGYRLTYDLTAQQMGEKIEVHLYDVYDGESEEVSLYSTDLSTEYENGFSFGPKDYFAEVKGDDSYSEELKDLCSAMENYGEYAREYFGNLYGEVGTAAEINDVTPESLSVYKSDITSAADGAEYYGLSLLLRTKTLLRFYYLSEPADISVSDSENNAVAYNTGRTQGMFYIEIPDISAKDLDERFTVTADGTTVKASALTYAYNSLITYSEKAEQSELCNVVKALYKYCEAANEFIANTEE